MSTGELSPQDEEVTGLVPGHAYAVLNVQQAGILKMLQVIYHFLPLNHIKSYLLQCTQHALACN